MKTGERVYDAISMPPATSRGMLGEPASANDGEDKTTTETLSYEMTASYAGSGGGIGSERETLAALTLARPPATTSATSTNEGSGTDDEPIVKEGSLGSIGAFWTERRADLWAALGLTGLLGGGIATGSYSAAPANDPEHGTSGASAPTPPRGPARGLVAGSQPHTHADSPAIRTPRRTSAGGVAGGTSLTTLFPGAVPTEGDSLSDKTTGAYAALKNANADESI